MTSRWSAYVTSAQSCTTRKLTSSSWYRPTTSTSASPLPPVRPAPNMLDSLLRAWVPTSTTLARPEIASTVNTGEMSYESLICLVTLTPMHNIPQFRQHVLECYQRQVQRARSKHWNLLCLPCVERDYNIACQPVPQIVSPATGTHSGIDSNLPLRSTKR
jgi:hypothetical protein